MRGDWRSTLSSLHFIIQEHHASNIHFDLRLEWEGKFLSWIIPKNISMNPKVKRTAIQIENYINEDIRTMSGHEKQIWDIGKWKPECEDVGDALNKGSIVLRLEGRRIFGRFKLSRSEDKGKNHWMIWRVDDFDPWPGFIPPIVPIRRQVIPQGEEYLYELKNEGIRLEAHLFSEVSLWSEKKVNWTKKLPLIVKGLKELRVDSIILDGEIVSYDEKGHTKLSLLYDNLKHHRFDLIRYVISDILYLNGKDLRKLPLMERKLILEDLELPVYFEISRYFFEDGISFFEAAQSLDLEGIVSKEIDSSYARNKWIEIRNPTSKKKDTDFSVNKEKKTVGVRTERKEKIVYELEGITKKEIVLYYSDFSKMIYRLIKNKKVLSLKCTKGSIGSCFYWPDIDEAVPLSGSGAIKELALNSTLEFHINSSSTRDPSKTSEIVFSLEADSNFNWDILVKCALELKALLEENNLKSFIKLSSLRGFHLHIPLSVKESWDKVKIFSEQIAHRLANKRKDYITLENIPSKRRGKILLDVSMNAPDRFVIAPYSLKSGRISFICLPVEWNELPKLNRELSLSLTDARKKIYSRSKDPWKDYLQIKQKLSLIK